MIPTHTFQETPRKDAAIRIRWIVIAVAITCLALFVPRTLSGQASAGITGTITDTSGAVVANANVTVTNEGTSVTDHTTYQQRRNVFLQRPPARQIQSDR